MNYRSVIIILIILIPLIAGAHGEKKKPVNKPDTNTVRADTTVNKQVTVSSEYSSQKPETFIDWLSIRLPTKHPIVIHFPIILLLLSFPLFIFCVFFGKEDFRLLAVIICGGGFLGGLAASFIFHPHTAGLPPVVAEALEYHEFFAEATLSISGLATLAGASTLLKQYRKKFIEYIALALMGLAIISVSITGHFGGTLAYVYGVGTQGKYLEKEGH